MTICLNDSDIAAHTTSGGLKLKTTLSTIKTTRFTFDGLPLTEEEPFIIIIKHPKVVYVIENCRLVSRQTHVIVFLQDITALTRKMSIQEYRQGKIASIRKMLSNER
jgi:hypothetical protein